MLALVDELNNAAKHAVGNPDDAPIRIHLILDWVEAAAAESLATPIRIPVGALVKQERGNVEIVLHEADLVPRLADPAVQAAFKQAVQNSLDSMAELLGDNAADTARKAMRRYHIQHFDEIELIARLESLFSQAAAKSARADAVAAGNGLLSCTPQTLETVHKLLAGLEGLAEAGETGLGLKMRAAIGIERGHRWASLAAGVNT
eukprot:SAG31_NODE_16118_length_722_cov_0.988764_1_plen_204_part_00